MRDKELEKLISQFSMVRCADVKTAKRVQPKSVPELIFYDGDGAEIFRTPARAAKVKADLEKALGRYKNKKISWATGSFEQVKNYAREKEKVIALTFVDGKQTSALLNQALENRWIAKHHEKFVFFSIPFVRDSELSKQYNVTTCPSLLLINPNEDNRRKAILVRPTSLRTTRSVRAALLTSLKRFEDSIKGE